MCVCDREFQLGPIRNSKGMSLVFINGEMSEVRETKAKGYLHIHSSKRM